MKPILRLAFTLVAVNIVMGDGDSDYDYDYEPLDCTAEDVYACSSEVGDACIKGEYVCDAEIDCVDGSDEADCGEGWEATPFDEWYYEDDLDCSAEDVYTCSSEFGDACIPELYVCDTMVDCEDGSDEADCGEDWEATPYDEWSTSTELDCTAEDVYTCSSEYGDACIRGDYVCDALIDCEDGSDEADCGEGWEAEPFDEWYYDDEEVRADARRKATTRAVKQARVKARADAVAKATVE